MVLVKALHKATSIISILGNEDLSSVTCPCKVEQLQLALTVRNKARNKM